MRIHDQRLPYLQAIVGQHLLETILHGFYHQAVAVLQRRENIVARRCHHRAASHQILVNGEALHVAQALGGDHHQHVHVARHAARAQVHLFDGVVLHQLLPHHVPTRDGGGRAAVGALYRLCRGMPQANGLEEARRGALQHCLDLAAQVGLAHVARWIEQLPLVPDLQDRVEIVGIGRKKRDGNRPQPVGVKQNLAGDGAVRSVGINHLEGELAPRFRLDVLGHFLDELRHLRQRLRQRLLGDKDRQFDGLFHAGKDRVKALEAVDNFLNRAGQVVLQVPQTDLHLTASRLHLDQVLESQRNRLIAVADQNIKVGADHRRFVAPGDAERYGANAINLIGFRF